MDILANNVIMVSDETQETSRIVLLLQPVMLVTKLLDLVISLVATLAEHALLHSFQDQTDLSATDQDQLAHALRDTLLMDTAAFHAQLAKSLITPDKHAMLPQNAMPQGKFSVQLQTAINAETAQPTLFQILTEEHVLDQSQFAHALKDTQLMDMNAKNVEPDKLLIQITTRDASQESVTRETKSSHPETTAGDVMFAHKDMSQTHQEQSVLESSQLAAALRSMTQADMSACHAHHTKLLLTVTKDVSQDNVQDSTRFLELLTNAMPVNNAKRDLLQTT
jgi:hypothetical protein